MRPLRTAILTAAVALGAPGLAAEPAAGAGYRLEALNLPDAFFAGLARDGDDLLVTNLADGRLYRRGADGNLAAFGPVLPHGIDVIGDPTGPYRIAPHGDGFIVAQGWTPVDADEGPHDHALLRVGRDGAVSVIADDFWNPFDFALSGDTLYVVDAARNSLERIAADGTGKTTLFAFARISQAAAAMQSLSPTEFAEGATYEFDAVPTGVALRGDGRLYVSLFGGFPFVAGAGSVVSLPVDGQAGADLRVEVGELNAPVDLAFDTAGGLLVLEHGLYDQASGFRPGTGRLVALDGGAGDRRVILDGLTRPVAVLVWDERRLVVSDLGGNLYFLRRDPAD